LTLNEEHFVQICTAMEEGKKILQLCNGKKVLHSRSIGECADVLIYESSTSFWVFINNLCMGKWEIIDNRLYPTSIPRDMLGEVIHVTNNGRVITQKHYHFHVYENYGTCIKHYGDTTICEQISCAVFGDNQILFMNIVGTCVELGQNEPLFTISLPTKGYDICGKSYYFPEDHCFMIQCISLKRIILYDTRSTAEPYFSYEVDSVMVKDGLIYTLKNNTLSQFNLHGELLSYKENVNMDSLEANTLQIRDNYVDLITKNNVRTRYNYNS